MPEENVNKQVKVAAIFKNSLNEKYRDVCINHNNWNEIVWLLRQCRVYIG